MKETNFSMDRGRFETRRVANEIPLFFRCIMWMLVDELVSDESIQVDYLQIFRFSIRADEQGNKVQILRHSQEQPPYEAIYEFPDVEEGLEMKVWCIDDGTTAVMTTPEER